MTNDPYRTPGEVIDMIARLAKDFRATEAAYNFASSRNASADPVKRLGQELDLRKATADHTRSSNLVRKLSDEDTERFSWAYRNVVISEQAEATKRMFSDTANRILTRRRGVFERLCAALGL